MRRESCTLKLHPKAFHSSAFWQPGSSKPSTPSHSSSRMPPLSPRTDGQEGRGVGGGGVDKSTLGPAHGSFISTPSCVREIFEQSRPVSVLLFFFGRARLSLRSIRAQATNSPVLRVSGLQFQPCKVEPWLGGEDTKTPGWVWKPCCWNWSDEGVPSSIGHFLEDRPIPSVSNSSL